MVVLYKKNLRKLNAIKVKRRSKQFGVIRPTYTLFGSYAGMAYNIKALE